MVEQKTQIDDNELQQAINEEHCSGSLERKLALAIIRANPSSSQSDERKRLNAALAALLGDKYHKDSKYLNLRDALYWMADQYIQDRGGPKYDFRSADPLAYIHNELTGARTAKQLAIEASRRIPNAPSVRHLENEFGMRRRGLCRSIILGSDVPGSLHRQTIEAVQSLLEPFGIEMDVDAI